MYRKNHHKHYCTHSLLPDKSYHLPWMRTSKDVLHCRSSQAGIWTQLASSSHSQAVTSVTLVVVGGADGASVERSFMREQGCDGAILTRRGETEKPLQVDDANNRQQPMAVVMVKDIIVKHSLLYRQCEQRTSSAMGVLTSIPETKIGGKTSA